MVRKILLTAWLIFGAIYCSFAQNNQEITVEMFKKGIYEGHQSGNTNLNNSSKDNMHLLEDVYFVEEGNSFIGTIGKRFGLQYTIKSTDENLKEIKIHFKITHPPFKNNNRTLNEFDATKKLFQINLFGYKFDHDYELVFGNWIFEIYYNNTLLLKEEFEIKDK